jgi:hypothetical protein
MAIRERSPKVNGEPSGDGVGGKRTMTDVAVSRIPAGWYPDPLGQARHRWWDSTTWTQHVTAGPKTTAAPSSFGMQNSPAAVATPSIPDRMRER